MKPLGDRVLIEADKAKKETDAGLIIPDTVAEREKPPTGTVFAAGPGLSGSPMPIQVGERVMYAKHAGLPIRDPRTNKEYLIMRVTDVWMVL